MDLKKPPLPKLNKDRTDPFTPGMVEVARRDYRVAREKLTKTFDWTMNTVFDTSEWGGRLRRWLFIGLGAFIWAWAAGRQTPSIQAETFFEAFVTYPFQALFAPAIFRHVLVFGLVFWLAIQMSAAYLDDVFELNHPGIAERYILQASLAERYRRIEIKAGKVPDSHIDSTIVRIGGPGLVRVHYDSAALFEKYDGDPTVVLAEDGLIALDRFERLRKVLLLRDHIEETQIKSRTRDGINVIANGVRVKYHIHRDDIKLQEGKIPFPAVRGAIETLVYKDTVTKWIDPISSRGIDDRPPEAKHPESLPVKPDSIFDKLTDFIAQSTLGEFLARVSEPELEERQSLSEAIEAEALSLTGENPAASQPPVEETAKPKIKGKFYPRNEITDLIYQGNDQRDKLASGLELDWIDIGTWEFPENARQIVEQHRHAWQLSLENLKNRSPKALAAVEENSRMRALRAFIQEILLTFQAQQAAGDDQETIKKLLHLYRQKMVLAQEIFRTSPEHKATPIPLSKTISRLGDVLDLTRTIGHS